MKPTLKAPGTKLLKLKYDEPLSIFAFKFNLRRYITEWNGAELESYLIEISALILAKVGGMRKLKPVLKAPGCSA